MVVVIGITGLAGSGKTLLSDYLQRTGIQVFRTGDVVREIAKSRGIPHTSLGKISHEFLPSENTEIIKNICYRIDNLRQERFVVVEGIKKMSEVEVLRKNYNTCIVAILASQETRFKRLLNRNRSDDPISIDYLKERDERELKYGIGNVIALADCYLINEGKKEALIDNFSKAFKKMEKNMHLINSNGYND